MAAGVREIEAVAFVSPRAVPSMAGAADGAGRPADRAGGRYWALVPNLRGAELALEAGVDALTVTVAASEGYSQRNVTDVGGGVGPLGRAHRRPGRRPGSRSTWSCRAPSARPTKVTWPRRRWPCSAAACSTAGPPASPWPTPPAWPHPPGSTPSWPRPGVERRAPPARDTGHRAGQRLRRHPGRGDPVRHLHRRPRRLAVRRRARPATWPPRTSSICSTTSAIDTGIDLEPCSSPAASWPTPSATPVPSRVAAAGPRLGLAAASPRR